jgi:hypothetical protein
MVERGDADIAQGLDADMDATLKPGPRLALVEGLTMSLSISPTAGKSMVRSTQADLRPLAIRPV